MQIGQVALRGVQFLMTLLITALIGNVIAEAFAGNPSAVNFAIFVAVFSWIVLLFGAAAAFITSLAIPVVLIALDAIATLLTFIAGVVLAARLGVHSCNNAVSCAALQLLTIATDAYKRDILAPTASPMALPTQESDAASFKQARLSSGSCSSHMLQVLQ